MAGRIVSQVFSKVCDLTLAYTHGADSQYTCISSSRNRLAAIMHLTRWFQLERHSALQAESLCASSAENCEQKRFLKVGETIVS